MACNSTIAAIEEFCGPNSPGLDRVLHATTTAKIAANGIAAASSHVISTDIAMEASQLWYEWHFSKNDQVYTSSQDENGMWNTTAEIFIHKLQSATSTVLNGLGGDNNVVVLQDKNGRPILIGDKNNGCTITVEEMAQPKNGYKVVITWQSAHSPYEYTGATPTS